MVVVEIAVVVGEDGSTYDSDDDGGDDMENVDLDEDGADDDENVVVEGRVVASSWLH